MAGGGIAATAADYVRFADMLCAGGVGTDGCRVLSENMVRRMATPNMPEEIDMGGERWGFGMRIVTAPGYPHGLGVGCFGWSGFYGTHFWVDPENKLTIVMMKNSYFDGGAGNSSACQLEKDVSEALK
jgi:CubicO group peptidase (beta-lactamase class C family)